MNGTRFPLVSVVILSWNGRKYLENCLESVLKSDYPRFEVIVSDNGSTDGSIELVRRNPRVILIENNQNLGFSRGNNRAIRAASGDIIILLNQDTYVDPNWIRNIVVPASDPCVGIVGCKLLYPHTNVVQSVGYRVHRSGYPLPEGAFHHDHGQDYEEVTIDYATGAALAVKRSVLERIGLLDAGYQAYYEETDLCFRARKEGFRIVIAPKAIVYHYGSISHGGSSFRKCYLNEKSRLRYLLKNYTLAEVALGLLVYDLQWDVGKLIALREHRLDFQKETIMNTGPQENKSGLWSFVARSISAKLAAYIMFFITETRETIAARYLLGQSERLDARN